MDTKMLYSLTHLSDHELLSRVHELAAREREATTILIAHLAELDARGLHLAEGYPSLFKYCTQALHLSEYAAYARIEAARIVRKFRVVLQWLVDGSVTLTTVGLLAPHLTRENHQKLLAMARHKSKREVEELIAALRPQPPVPALLRRLPVRQQQTPPPPESPPTLDATHTEAQPRAVGEDGYGSAISVGPVPARVPTPAVSLKVMPLAPGRFKVQFTASTQTYEKLRRAQALLRHQIPDGNLDEIVDRALTALLRDLARQKFAATDHPRKSQPTIAGSRHIPADVKRAVWIRDGGRCAFVGKKGRRCAEDSFLEFHHVRAYAAGGESTVDNIQLRCRAHNAYEAELDFGPRNLPVVKETRACYWVRT